MILLVLALLFTGGRRLRCINSLCGDPIVERFCSLRQLPTARSVARWMKEFDNDSVIGLRRVYEELVGSLIRAMDLPRLTIDIDGSVLSTGLHTEGAKRGYNPHRRNGELKSGFAFAAVPTQSYHANSAWQLLNLMAFNINRAMQATANREQRARTHKRRSLLRYEHINTLRQRLIHRAGLLLNVSGKAMLDLGANETVLKSFVTWQSNLQKAA